MSWREQLDIMERDIRAQARRMEPVGRDHPVILDEYQFSLIEYCEANGYPHVVVKRLAASEVYARPAPEYYWPQRGWVTTAAVRGQRSEIPPEMIGGKAYYTERIMVAAGYLPVHRYEWGLVAQLGPQSPLHFLRALIRTIRP